MAASDSSSNTVALRVTGLGHTLTLEPHLGSSTVADLKREIEARTGILAAHQRLLARGHKLEDGDAVTLEQAGLKGRTKIMLLHNELYGKEKEGYEELAAIAKEIDDLASKKKDKKVSQKVVSELVTRICCKLDQVDTKDSDTLRAYRKDLLRKAESVDDHHHRSDSSKEAVEG
jgi:hypothetical protein